MTRIDRDRLLELAARCEAASGADAEINAVIHFDVLGHCRHARKVRSGAQSDTGFDCLDCGADSWGNKGPKGESLNGGVPNYTGSIDAALMLVPEGMFARLYFEFPQAIIVKWRRAYIEVARSTALTMPNALTAASLKARASAQEGHPAPVTEEGEASLSTTEER